jgi:hypothetical protein
MKALDKVKAAANQDESIYTERGKETESFGHNPQFLLDVHGITKSDLIRLERLGLATKARYVQRNKRNVSYFSDAQGNPVPVDGPHRVRWLIFKESA